MSRLLAIVATLLVLLVSERPAWAHAAPHSVVLLDLHANDVGVELRLPVLELEAALGHPLPEDAVALLVHERAAIRDLVTRDLHARSPDDAPWTIDIGDLEHAVDEQGPVVVVAVMLAPSAGHSAQVLSLDEGVIGNEVPNHNAWVAVRSDFAQGLVAGEPAVLGVAHFGHHVVPIDRRGGGATRGFRAVLLLGVRHIAEGTDHLLFLLTLLLPASLLIRRTASGRRVWGAHADLPSSVLRLVRVVTAFTLGHSLTLLLGSVGWVRLPGAPVETLIAVSILISAVHAIRPLFPGREACISGGFGLVHGLAFASALAELHLDAARLALALLGFNLGIEAMQLAVVAATFPWLLLMARTRFYVPFRVGGAAFAGIAAIGWTAERALSLPNPIGSFVAAIAAHPLVLLWLLAGGAVAARVSGDLVLPAASMRRVLRAPLVRR